MVIVKNIKEIMAKNKMAYVLTVTQGANIIDVIEGGDNIKKYLLEIEDSLDGYDTYDEFDDSSIEDGFINDYDDESEY